MGKLPLVDRETKAMILTTLWYNLFDNAAVREQIVKTLEVYTTHLDTELQQRALDAWLSFSRPRMRRCRRCWSHCLRWCRRLTLARPSGGSTSAVGGGERRRMMWTCGNTNAKSNGSNSTNNRLLLLLLPTLHFACGPYRHTPPAAAAATSTKLRGLDAVCFDDDADLKKHKC